MLDEETFDAIRALHLAFFEARGDFFPPAQEEPPAAEIETSCSWPSSIRSAVMLGVALIIVCSSLYPSIARIRRKYFAPIKRHPRRRLSNDEGI